MREDGGEIVAVIGSPLRAEGFDETAAGFLDGIRERLQERAGTLRHESRGRGRHGELRASVEAPGVLESRMVLAPAPAEELYALLLHVVNVAPEESARILDSLLLP